MIFLTVDPLISSPPIRKGSKHRKFWLYQRRIERLCNLKANSYFESFAISDAVTRAMDYCEELGYTPKEDDYGRPHWYRSDGTIIIGYTSEDSTPVWFDVKGNEITINPLDSD